MTRATQGHRSGIQMYSNPKISLGGSAFKRMMPAPAQPPAGRFTAKMSLGPNQGGIVAMNPMMSRQTNSIYGAIQSSQK